jgi:hypothetical protein
VVVLTDPPGSCVVTELDCLPEVSVVVVVEESGVLTVIELEPSGFSVLVQDVPFPVSWVVDVVLPLASSVTVVTLPSYGFVDTVREELVPSMFMWIVVTESSPLWTTIV